MDTNQKIEQRIREEMAMVTRSSTVYVEQVPEISNMREGRLFLHEITNRMSSDRPLIVLDCSHVRQVDRALIHTLLCCLEEALKRNGDVKLAALPSAAKTALQRAAGGRIFEIYATTNGAVNSYLHPAEALDGNVWSAA